MQTRDLNKEVSMLLEAKFLSIFHDKLMDKQLINTAILEKESVYILPREIYLLPKNIYEGSEKLSNGYYFIEDQDQIELVFIKDGITEKLGIDPEQANKITDAIHKKKTRHDPAKPLNKGGIQSEYEALTNIIQANPGHENALFTKKCLSLTDCEQKKIFTADGTINREACHLHSVVIDEKRINIGINYHAPRIKLSDRENLIFDAVISNAHHQIFQTTKSENIYDELSGLSENEKESIWKAYIGIYQSFLKDLIPQLGNMGLKGAPFYEPTEEFKINLYLILFEHNESSFIESMIANDAKKIMTSLQEKNKNMLKAEIADLATEALFKKYTPHFNNLTQKNSLGDLVTFLKKSVAEPQITKPVISGQKSEALRLVTRRCEGLVKMLSPLLINFKEILKNNDNKLLEKDIQTVDQKWEFTLQQILDPQSNRPKRYAIPDPIEGFSFSPKLQMQVSPDELEVKSLEHTVMTSTTLLAIDGKMKLFGASHHPAIGLLFDIRMSDLVGENFVFNTDTLTFNDWWHNPHATRYHKDFKGFTVDGLIKDQKLNENVDHIREYGEILAGVSASGLVGIIFQPAVDVYQSNVKDMDYYEERLNLIYRKLYIATLIGRHLPIIIYDANKGVHQYTIDEQREDLLEMTSRYPNHAILKALLSNLDELCVKIPEETDRKAKPDIKSADIALLEKKKNLKLQIYQMQNDINQLNVQLYKLINRHGLLPFKKATDLTISNLYDSYLENTKLNAQFIDDFKDKLNTSLEDFKKIALPEEYQAVLDFTQQQEKFILEQTNKDNQCFQEIIAGIYSKTGSRPATDKNALSYLIQLYNDPYYSIYKKEISHFITEQKKIIQENIRDEIAKDYPPEKAPETSFFSSIFSSSQIDNPTNFKNKLIITAMNDFEKNIALNPRITTVEQLVITHTKRVAIRILNEAIEKENNKVMVSPMTGQATVFKPDEDKIKRHQFLIAQLSTLDIEMPLHTFINTHKHLKIDYNDPVIKRVIDLAINSIFTPKQMQYGLQSK